MGAAYSQIALSSLAAGQTLADFVRDFMLASARDGRVPNGLFFEFDGHRDGSDRYLCSRGVRSNFYRWRWISNGVLRAYRS